MPLTISPSDADKMIIALREGKIDLNAVSMAEYMQISYLMLISEDELHIDQKIVYGGNVFTLHACVQSVNPATSTSIELIREKQ